MAQPLIPSAGAPLVVKPSTGFLSVTSARGRLEWDGATLSYKVGLQRRELVRAGEGSLLRVTFAAQQLHARGPRLLWVGPDGRERADLDARQWPIDELLHVAALARVPVTDVGKVTYREFYERYPALLPTIGGLDPQTPVTWGSLREAMRPGSRGGQARGLTPRDRVMLVLALAAAASWVAARAAGIAP